MEPKKLQRVGVIEILLDLLENGPSQKTTFRKRLGLSPTTLVRAHEMLWEGGYLETEPHPRKLLFKLSEKGEYVARLLKEVVEEGAHLGRSQDFEQWARLIQRLGRFLQGERES